MKLNRPLIAALSALLFLAIGARGIFRLNKTAGPEPSSILSYEVNPKNGEIHFFLKNEAGENFGNHGNLKNWLEKNSRELVFAMNGGMYLKDSSPQGLYIENGKTVTPVDTVQNAYGNFYLQPNGIFYITTDH